MTMFEGSKAGGLTSSEGRSAAWVPDSPAARNRQVVPYYLDDRKRRISIARVDGRRYAFDDLCPCAPQAWPLSGGLPHRDDDHVPMPRLAVRHPHWSRDQRSSDRGPPRVRGPRGRRRHSSPSLTRVRRWATGAPSRAAPLTWSRRLRHRSHGESPDGDRAHRGQPGVVRVPPPARGTVRMTRESLAG